MVIERAISTSMGRDIWDEDFGVVGILAPVLLRPLAVTVGVAVRR